MSVVLDASAMIAYLRNEEGGSEVASLLEDGNTECLAHAVNLCEVYYHLLQRSDQHVAEKAINDLRFVGITVVEVIDNELLKWAGKFKLSYGFSYGDSFLLALARNVNAEVVTADHTDFDPVAHRGAFPVRFIR